MSILAVGSTFKNFQVTLAGGKWEQMTTLAGLASNVNGVYPCSGVDISARASSANANNIYFILSSVQPANSLDIGESVLPASATGINHLLTTDADTVFFWAVTAGDRVNCCIRL
jgi:hypothetical protein